MRSSTVVKLKPREGDRRIAEWFAWLPVSVEQHGQLQPGVAKIVHRRWLERVTMRQEYTIILSSRILMILTLGFCGDVRRSWKNIEFVDETIEKLKEL